MAAQYDFIVDRGATLPDVTFRVRVDGSGSAWRFLVEGTGGEIDVYASGTAQLLAVVQPLFEHVTEVTWKPGVIADFATPLNYELEQTEPDGTRVIWVRGKISTTGLGLGVEADG
ncbi:hypothetical protein KHC28_00465 [Ancylobacter sonchi]|uniref:hypothetical protein n=1 Tax=Ancylobacter sonchi TaxID=1937790 RepID=UPI001BD4FDD0|nr:hypothetical protein [Ancylobacter sonchi]MBS7532138.1 hypothetical protein [Ancylobacter sonchi]